MHSRLLLVPLLLLLPALVQAKDWPQFRGPNGNGLSPEGKFPSEWGAEKNVGWKVKIPGVAWSQPIVWGDKVFVTTAVSDKQRKPALGGGGMGGGRPGGNRPPGGRPPGGGGGGMGRGGPPPDAVYRWEVLCLDRQSGEVLWKQTALEGKPSIPTHSTNTYASETPVTDGERVYAYFGMTGLFCYDLKGNLLWKKNLGSYPMMAGWGTGSSPVLEGNRLFIQCDNEEKSFLVAFDKKSGDELWRMPREERSTWGTPYVWRNKQRTEIVTAGARKVRSYDPASGKILWEMGGITGRCSATPVGDAELLYVGTGGGPAGPGPLFAVKAGATGEITVKAGEPSEHLAWSLTRSGPPKASPLLYQGYLYILDERGGLVTCLDAKTGVQKYKERIPGAKGFTSSPWAYDGKVFCLDEEGQTFVLQAGPDFKVQGKNVLSEMFWSSAALAGGALYLRGVDHLYCIRQ